MSTQLPDHKALSVCCCCLELAWKQCLWKPHTWMDRQEIYGEMLQECFAILYPNVEHKRVLICELCITQLRSALNFKRQVLTCQELLLNNDVELQKMPNLNKSSMPKGMEVDADDSCEYYANDDQLSNFSHEIASPAEPGPPHIANDFAKELELIGNKEQITKPYSSNKENEENKKNVKKKPKEKLGKQGEKRYTNYLKPRLNVGLLLENSTLLPFKADKGCFLCFYCVKQFALFEELKQHTIMSHSDVSSKDIIKRLYKPERVRAEASNISCKICHQKLDTVSSLVEHLIRRHDIKFSDHERKPVDCIIAYDLSDGKNRCIICKKEFFFFKSLSKHMNEHTTNYVCPICGKCFLLPKRLQTHKNAHKAGPSVECGQCGKKMKNEYLLKAHIRNVHNKPKYGCTVCNLKFCTFRDRLAHLDKSHGMKTTNLKCSQCDKSFKLPQTLSAHMRHTHMKIRNDGHYPCNMCSRVFNKKSGLKTHSLVHTKERNFECRVCNKKFGRNSTLLEHLRIHADERRWACGACGAAFVQKCRLRAHINGRHAGADISDLVICRKRQG
ncbi:zinc finger protein 135 isoform X2 [Manduca sexta]|uniref:C2H2-type domain-containing protein n=3 Tax=Manduca sexta TaxID=7130 RepID=A0A921ZMA9_MANSE|nr:zinc finger protein 135 isoform X2 [Manduca sexta]XP_030033807.1 zinc finger protein 135 isoform X2 [Manduca sexta]KAG6460255.1 hypothetical protein O3G_MSEX011860 [Manduca sexta]